MLYRLIRYSSCEAGRNEALEEGMLLARHQGQSLDTVRIWWNKRAVILGGGADLKVSVDEEVCKKNGVAVVRRASFGRETYQDQGTLNLTYVIDHKKLLPETEDLTELYKRLYKPVVDLLSGFGLNGKMHGYGEGLVVDHAMVSDAWLNFYYNLLSFQLSINVSTDLELSSRVLRHEKRFTSLSKELKRKLAIKDVERRLIGSVAKRFEMEFREEQISKLEEELAERLHAVKYSRSDWNVNRMAPLSIKDVLVEVYVAYPPTTSCREIIKHVRSATEDLQDRVEVRIWMRGKGLDGRGSPLGVPWSAGLMEAAKRSIVPAIVIKGEIAFSRHVPSSDDFHSRVVRALGD